MRGTALSRRQLSESDAAEGLRLLEAAEPIRQDLPPLVAFYILSHLQLALRHPGTKTSGVSRVVRAAAVALGDAIVARVPEMRDLIEAGWDESRDR
jgi:hypothetical protein